MDLAKNVLVDARFKNILKKKRSSINFGQIFDFSFSKETEASYWRRGELPWLNFEIWKKNSKNVVYIFSV